MNTSSPAASIQAVLISDLVGSTNLLEQIGDVRGARLWEKIDRAFRDLLREYSGKEIDKTDGFLLVFNRSVDAVGYALQTHRILDKIASEEGLNPALLKARVGIHVGEVVLRGNSTEDILGGAKQVELDGLAKPYTARLMSLAGAGQTLLSRTAFDLARRASVGDDTIPETAQWLAHGSYLFHGIEDSQDVFEVGVPGEAPLSPPPDSEKARRAVNPGDEAVLGWRPAAGQTVPGRSNFILREKLGEGGFGEVWLAHHVKTREPRVFKFCFQAERLRGLKREVTLFRLLKEGLGDRDDIARVLDWRFDEAPYYLELEHTQGGSLPDWASAEGGINTIPLETRLELLAQVAEALAAAHSVGVLHKDVKPSNILINPNKGGQPQARLTDFGIGLVLDRERLAAQGITASGLTEISATSAPDSSRTGTRLYMAPELLEGKPATTLSDIYALGVVLYQIVVGDFDRALAVGWERQIEDIILLEDIRACVDGNPSSRIASASELAILLRNREERRAEREAKEVATTVQARQQKRRRLLVVAVAFTSVTALLSIALATRESRRARAELELRQQVTRQKAAIASERDTVAVALGELLSEVGSLELAEKLKATSSALSIIAVLPRKEMSPFAVRQLIESSIRLGDARIRRVGDYACPPRSRRN